MILILDTGHLTAIQRQTEPACTILSSRLQTFENEDVCTTIISFEEQMRGWLAVIARSKNIEQEVNAYERLNSLLEFFGSVPVLDFTADCT